MKTIMSRNVNDAYFRGLCWLSRKGEEADSRNGPVIESPVPVTTIYDQPQERVLFDEVRDANPFFHLMESLWMLAGRRDTEFLSLFNKRMITFSDNGENFNGAYGYRWRNWWAEDQLLLAIQKLTDNPRDRRVVISMWDPEVDMVLDSKDIPCNDMIKFHVRTDGKTLDMMVFNRSNDAIWGCYGANAVHFSVLHEVVAACAGLTLGRYYQISTNFHVYKEIFDKMHPEGFLPWSPGVKEYISAAIPQNIVRDPATFLDQCEHFVTDDSWISTEYSNEFLTRVARPMRQAYAYFREGDLESALQVLPQDKTDWIVAGRQWLLRRKERKS